MTISAIGKKNRFNGFALVDAMMILLIVTGVLSIAWPVYHTMAQKRIAWAQTQQTLARLGNARANALRTERAVAVEVGDVTVTFLADGRAQRATRIGSLSEDHALIVDESGEIRFEE